MMPTPIIVVDTDVWIAALAYGGKSRHVLTRAIQEGHTIVTSDAIFSEVRRALKSKLPGLIPDFEALLIALRWRLQMVELGNTSITIGTTARGRGILETAIAGQAGVIVTGNTRLINLGSYKGILIVPPQVW